MKLEYRLMQGDILLGELFDVTVDQPFFECDFAATPAFDSVRALFDRAYAESSDEAFDELEKLGVWLSDAITGAKIHEEGWFLCQIQDDKARFRM